MADDEKVEGGWSLRDEEIGLLIRITEVLRSLTALAGHGNDLIALGEAWNALEVVIDGQCVEVDIGLDVGFRCGNRDFEEGLYMCFRVNNEEIILDELNTTYSRDVGSDHSTRVYARLERGGRLDEVGVEGWIAKLEEVKRFEDTQLNTYRDHL